MNHPCPSCGTQLAADSPGGLCPDCLLTAGLGVDEAKNGDVAAVTTPQPGVFIPPKPDSLAEHFPQLEILESLGHGGMCLGCDDCRFPACGFGS